LRGLRQAAGAAMALVDAVVAGASPQRPAPAGFAICRPPGARPRSRRWMLQAMAAQEPL